MSGHKAPQVTSIPLTPPPGHSHYRYVGQDRALCGVPFPPGSGGNDGRAMLPLCPMCEYLDNILDQIRGT